MNNKIDSMLGLCQKAGKLASGEFKCEQVIKSKEAQLVIIAGDASLNTKEKFKKMSEHKNIQYIEYGTKEVIGRAIGKDYRASIVILDKGFKEALLQLLK